METYSSPATPSKDFFGLEVDQQAQSYLRDTAKWAKFLSIVGFICCGLLVVFAVLMATVMGSFMSAASTEANAFATAYGAGYGVGFAAIYIIMAVIYFFPTLYLNRFASKMQVAINNNDQASLLNSFGNLRACFKFVGILTIISLAFMVLAFGAVIITAMATL